MAEETLVQAAQGFPDTGAHQQAGAAHPQYIGRGVILAVVFFYFLEDASAAEGIAVAVHQAARRTGVFEGVALGIGDQLGPAGAAVRMAVHPVHQGLQPAFRHFDIGVDEQVIIGLQLRQGAVVAAREAVILVQLDERNVREFGLHKGGTAVGGGVVGHYHLGVQTGAGGHQAREKLPEVVLGVIIQYDNCSLQALTSTLVKAREGMSLDRQGRASRAVARRFPQRVRKLPVMSSSRTGCTRWPPWMRKPSMP